MADDIDLCRTQVGASIMRAALEAIQELHKAVAFYGEDADWWVCGHCHDNHPCATRRLADQGLGGGQDG